MLRIDRVRNEEVRRRAGIERELASRADQRVLRFGFKQAHFGFKQAHGIEMDIFALKQTVNFYRNQDTPVYMCFLDAKKAFDS